MRLITYEIDQKKKNLKAFIITNQKRKENDYCPINMKIFSINEYIPRFKTHNFNSLFKESIQYSELNKIFETIGKTLTLRKRK
jgi:hypothetical protein